MSKLPPAPFSQVSGLSGFGGYGAGGGSAPPAPSRLLLHDARYGGAHLPLGVSAAGALRGGGRDAYDAPAGAYGDTSESALCECDELCDLLCTDAPDAAPSGRASAPNGVGAEFPR